MFSYTMRDYRTISAEEFLTESIEMKIRWLARQLRKLDIQPEIESWVLSVTSLTNLLWKIKGTGETLPKQISVRKPTQLITKWTISAPHSINSGEDNEKAVSKEVLAKRVNGKRTDITGDGSDAKRRKTVSIIDDEQLEVTNSMETESVRDSLIEEEVILSGTVGKSEDELRVLEETKKWMAAIKSRIDDGETSESLNWLTQNGWKILIKSAEQDLNLEFKNIPRKYRSQVRSNLWHGTKRYCSEKESNGHDCEY